jgi:hypothetical protein
MARGGRKKLSKKAIVYSRIQAAAEKLSGGGKYLFSLRQLFYELRPHLIRLLGEEPRYGTFSRIVGQYEDEYGEIDDLYRDDRGTLYHPHTGETISLGTRSVNAYERPPFLFRSLLFCEKEGLFPVLKHAKWPEQNDCALVSSKGFATRAVQALIRILDNSPELIVVFVLHDADGPGTVIFEALKRALEPYGVEVVNLGLEPAEARDMGLADEPVKRKNGKRVQVAGYVSDEDREWLQQRRIELNAMPTPVFIEWLSSKVSGHFASKGLSTKVLPPPQAVEERLTLDTRAALETRIREDVLREANYPALVEAAYRQTQTCFAESVKELGQSVPVQLESNPRLHWTDVVKAEAERLSLAGDGEKPSKNANSEALIPNRKNQSIFPCPRRPS